MGYVLPGDSVFPESVGVEPATGDAYAGSLADGTLYRLPADGGPAEVWRSPAPGGPGEVAGVKFSADGLLWAAGGSKGTLSVYRLGTRELVASLRVEGKPSVVNDIGFGPDRAALIPWLYRVSGYPLELSRWADLAAGGVPWADGLNLNGIVLAPDGEHLVSCQTNTGRFWRFRVADAYVDEVRVSGGPLPHCDGLALDGDRLYIADQREVCVSHLGGRARRHLARGQRPARQDERYTGATVHCRDDAGAVAMTGLCALSAYPRSARTTLVSGLPWNLVHRMAVTSRMAQLVCSAPSRSNPVTWTGP